MRLRRTRPPATWRRPTTLVAPSRRWRPRTRMRANSGKPTADRSCETAARVDRAPFPAQILAHGPVFTESRFSFLIGAQLIPRAINLPESGKENIAC